MMAKRGKRAVAAPTETPAAVTAEAAATEPTRPKKRTSETMREHWRLVKAGLRPPPQPRVREATGNPLLRLPDQDRARLFVWLRECPYRDAVKQMLREKGVPEVSNQEIEEFFELEANSHWQTRLQRAASEANALIQLAEADSPKFSAGILAALGQEAFRQVVSGEVDPDAMARLTKLFMQARSSERMDQVQSLRSEKLRHELQGQVEHALEKLAEEVERHPAAREAFEALQRELNAAKEQA